MWSRGCRRGRQRLARVVEAVAGMYTQVVVTTHPARATAECHNDGQGTARQPDSQTDRQTRTLMSLPDASRPLIKSLPRCHSVCMQLVASQSIMALSRPSGAEARSSGARGCPQPAMARLADAASSKTTQPAGNGSGSSSSSGSHVGLSNTASSVNMLLLTASLCTTTGAHDTHCMGWCWAAWPGLPRTGRVIDPLHKRRSIIVKVTQHISTAEEVYAIEVHCLLPPRHVLWCVTPGLKQVCSVTRGLGQEEQAQEGRREVRSRLEQNGGGGIFTKQNRREHIQLPPKSLARGRLDMPCHGCLGGVM